MNSTALVVLAAAILLRPSIRLLIEERMPVRKSDRVMLAGTLYTLIGVLCLILGMGRAYGGAGLFVAGLLVLGIPMLAIVFNPATDQEPLMKDKPDFAIAVVIVLLACLSVMVGLVMFMLGG